MVNNYSKEARIGLRLDKSLHDEFSKYCKQNAINSSELIRHWILRFVEHKRTENAGLVSPITHINDTDIDRQANKVKK